MSSLFNELEIIEVIKETKNAVSVAFKVDDQLKSEYQFNPGQYLTIETLVNGEKLRRAYSLCSSAVDGESLRVAIKRVIDGRVSNHINDHFKVGDRVSVMKPRGNFTVDINPNNHNEYVLIAGGSGITPMLSIIKSVLYSEPNSKLCLIYMNSDLDNIIFYDLIKKLRDDNQDRFKVFFTIDEPESEWYGDTGYLTSERLLGYLKGNIDIKTAHFYTCGPSPMMSLTVETLENNKVSDNRINVEFFGSDNTKKEATEISSNTDNNDNTISENSNKAITIINAGKESTITVDAESTILEAAIDNDVDPPYACQAGICASCKAKLISGRIELEDEMEGLSDNEIEDGYILTCIAKPASDDVVVEYEEA